MQITTVLHPEAVLENLKGRVQRASKAFIKSPNATNWNVQTREAFAYQQAFYFFHSSTRTTEQKFNLLVRLSKVTHGEWPDAICLSAIGESLESALRDHANCP